MRTVILRAGVAVAVAEEAGVWIEAAGLERGAEDIARGLVPLTLDKIADRHGYQPKMRAKTSLLIWLGRERTVTE